jgi:hypothetical protein
VTVVPVGLVLAQYERVSLRKLSEESHREEEAIAPAALVSPSSQTED